MYLISWTEQNCTLEASLGGRVTVEEMSVVYEELQAIVEDLQEQPFLLVIDYSKAKNFDQPTELALNEIRDFCIKSGAEKVFNVVREEDEVPLMTTFRLQNVMEGLEEFVTDPSVINWTPSVLGERLAA